MNRLLIIIVFFFFSCSDENEETYFGCTDENALNFDSFAIQDDNSCLYSLGCTDSLACNYNELASEDDGSCNYPEILFYESEKERDIKGIIDEKCADCHNKQGIALNYNVLIQDDGQILKKFINGNAVGYSYNVMPPPGYDPLTICEIEELKLWIENGMD